jgi:hypothetical protein
MAIQLRELIKQLTADPWRQEVGFSSEMEIAHQQLFQSDIGDQHAATIINNWIAQFQPCLFGRIAARLGLISYCILSENDLEQSDEVIRDKIQQSRLEWLQNGLRGEKSAFVIVALTRSFTNAQPDEIMKQTAQRLCELYLLQPIDVDQIYLDALELEIPRKNGSSKWRWEVGVNYFCAQGDKRWWQDHRIPGSMSFSMNSVGHLVKSGQLAGAMRALESRMSTESDEWRHPSLDSLERALIVAMQTIDKASITVSGRATNLLPLPHPLDERPKCPIDLPKELTDKDYCEYEGFYHTDHTVPSVYFIDSVERPTSITAQPLDFTYLFDDSLDNFDFINMGKGRQVATIGSDKNQGPSRRERAIKRGRSRGEPVTKEPQV